MKEQPRPARSRGRPIDESIDSALTEAALEEFVARGYHAMSMESIAAKAGVSKVSLYRRWSSKLAVVADILPLLSETTPVEDHGSLRNDIRSLLEESIESSSAQAFAKTLMRTMGEISDSKELLEVYRTSLLAPRLDQLRCLVERARNRGELRPGVSTDIVCTMIAGPLFLYQVVIITEAKVDLPDNLVDEITSAILGGIASQLSIQAKKPTRPH
jgi:AcrR family transcriptional regulator